MISIRMGRKTFDRLVALLADDPIFESRGNKPQHHVKVQLAAFLLRYGNRGCDVFDIGRKLGIGEGTVYDYCRRVSKAVRKLRSKFLCWPDPIRKAEISNFIADAIGFWLCLGSGDGSLVRFTEEPMLDGDQYRQF